MNGVRRTVWWKTKIKFKKMKTFIPIISIALKGTSREYRELGKP